MGYALRLRWEWLRRSTPGAVWASLASRPERIVVSMFQSSVTVTVGDGASAYFWLDSWLPAGPLCRTAPNLFAAVAPRRRRRTVRHALEEQRWTRDITGAPTAPVLLEYFEVWDTMETVQLDPLTPDRFVWRWSPCGSYTASSAYRAFFYGRSELARARYVWKAAVPPKLKFIFWLALHGRIWTADRRRRHGLQQEATCSLCDQEDETRDHLLSSCTVTREIWAWLLNHVGLQQLTPVHTSVTADWWLQTRKAVPANQRRAFDSVVMIVSWVVWNERNARIFRGMARSTAQICEGVRECYRSSLTPATLVFERCSGSSGRCAQCFPVAKLVS